MLDTQCMFVRVFTAPPPPPFTALSHHTLTGTRNIQPQRARHNIFIGATTTDIIAGRYIKRYNKLTYKNTNTLRWHHEQWLRATVSPAGSVALCKMQARVEYFMLTTRDNQMTISLLQNTNCSHKSIASMRTDHCKRKWRKMQTCQL